ncbi:conserved hypothetical protein [Streptomyces himastatinicus ATCC 53653]|uniref:Uncharacterized protein n=1 Tax=Streptomyces himastatinicus ATCC 53653 TaxID=457427 RepID=D9WJB0_9ACTN|nr:hypothetical protein [Streptomyces himastatinicus]EFL29207.1 conserved hypothetical protein [Streptomyces himastatinicus ATCC 53653]
MTRLAAARTHIALVTVDDIEYGARFLGSLSLHESRDPALLRHWAATAAEFGAALAPAEVPTPLRIVESEGGLGRGLLARYTSRPPTVELYTDSIDAAERLVTAHGWRDWFPAGSVRAAALAHEAVHERLHHGPGRTALKEALGHTALRLGRLRVLGHVAGAEELAAHAYAQAVCGLGRSPLLLSAALAASAAPVAPGREK